MEIPQIKDKITVRAFALGLAHVHKIFKENRELDIIERAKELEKYIIGDAELPEIQEDPTKSWVNTLGSLYTKQFEEDKEKRDKDWEEFKKTLPIIDNSVKSESDETDREQL